MRLLSCLLLSIVVALHSAVDAAAYKERRSTPKVFTPDFVQSVQKIVDAEGIPGLTLAIVNKTGPAELGAWGIKSENGTKMTTDVRRAFLESFQMRSWTHVPRRHFSILALVQKPSSLLLWES